MDKLKKIDNTLDFKYWIWDHTLYLHFKCTGPVSALDKCFQYTTIIDNI